MWILALFFAVLVFLSPLPSKAEEKVRSKTRCWALSFEWKNQVGEVSYGAAWGFTSLKAAYDAAQAACEKHSRYGGNCDNHYDPKYETTCEFSENTCIAVYYSPENKTFGSYGFHNTPEQLRYARQGLSREGERRYFEVEVELIICPDRVYQLR